MNPAASTQLGIKPFEAADYLQSDDAPEDAALFTKAVGDIARARDTGITREGLYNALGEQGSPSFATVFKVMHALGLEFRVGVRSAHG